LSAKDDESLLLSTAWVGRLAHLIGKGGTFPLKIGWDLLGYVLFINTVDIAGAIHKTITSFGAWAKLPPGCVIVLTQRVADFDSWQYRVSMLPALGSDENPLFV
jgi:hypothetical protein